MYKINGVDLYAEYGMVPGKIQGSNIPVSGCFDLPSRINDSFYEWQDEYGVEPYVDSDDIMLGGRDIVFTCSIIGEKSDVISTLKAFNSYISSLTGLVPFYSKYGTFNVYIVNAQPVVYQHATTITITMHEPIVDISGGVTPATGGYIYTIDGIPFLSFGLYTSSVGNRMNLTDMKTQQFTAYEHEGYQINKRTTKTISLVCPLIASGLSDFLSKIKSLYLLFSKPGLRTLVLVNDIERTCFASTGFKITDVNLFPNIVYATFSIDLIIISE